MSALYLRQQQRGGIIDLEAEGVKMLVRTEDDPAATTEEVSPPGTSLNAYSNTTTVQSVTQVVSSQPRIDDQNKEKEKQLFGYVNPLLKKRNIKIDSFMILHAQSFT